MAKRLKAAVHQMNCERVALGDSVVKFTRVGREWISEPVSDEIAEAAESHPHFNVYETDEEIEAAEVDPALLDFSDSVEVDRLLRSIPPEELPEMVRVIDGMAPRMIDTLLNALTDDQLREIVRQEVLPEDVVDYMENPVPVLRNFIVANAETLAEKRAEFVSVEIRAEGLQEMKAAVESISANLSAIDPNSLTEDEKALAEKLGLDVDGGGATPMAADRLDLTNEQRAGLPSLDPDATDDPENRVAVTGSAPDVADKPDVDNTDTANDVQDPLDAAIETAKRNKKAAK